jgi:hypothetical protein
MSTTLVSSRKRSSNVSPIKSLSSQQSKDLLNADKDLLRGLSQKEVEIEHLRNTLQAVQLRLETFKDLERDV